MAIDAVTLKVLKNEGFMAQVQPENFSLRLKVVGGNLTARQLRTIADYCEEYGDGHAHLTSRQGVEIPFIKYDDIDAVRSGLKGGGVDTGACGPQVRTVTACQGNAVCRSGCIDTYALALMISERYYGRKLPHKFKMGITGCANNCLKAEQNDLGIKGGLNVVYNKTRCNLCGACAKVCRSGAISIEGGRLLHKKRSCTRCGRCARICPSKAWDGRVCYLIYLGGMFGNRIAKAKPIVRDVYDAEEVLIYADAALSFFDTYANAGERFRTAIERVGWPLLNKALKQIKNQHIIL